jgi:hypothetical protein
VGHPFADGSNMLASLNATVVAALPEDLASEDILGRRGVRLVSGLWLRRELAARAGELGLDPESPRLFRDFAGRLARPEGPASARALATDVAVRLGRHLGCLLLTLLRGEAANRAVRPAWGDAQWRFWADVRRVVIGGGLLSESIGDVAVPAAQAILDAHDAGHVRIERSPWGDAIGLVGMARLLPAASDCRTVFDFGQTSVKRGLARYRAGRLAGVRVLSERPCPCPSPIGLSTDPNEVARQWADMLELMVETVGEARGASGGASEVSISLACDLRGGVPEAVETRACYGRLQVLRPNLTDLFRESLADRLATEVRIQLVNDGPAAALAEDPDDHCVVLTVGTAMGVGFPLGRDPRAEFDEAFRLDRVPR